MRGLRCGCVVLSLLLIALSGSARAMVVTASEPTTQDGFTYQYLPTFNSDTSGPNFQSILAVTETGTGHDLHSLLRFDLASVGLTAAQVASATLHLYVIDGSTVGFPFSNPSPTAAPLVQIYAVAAPWNEASVAWSTDPGPTGPLVAQSLVTGINQWVSFNVTGLLQGWLNSPATNNGFWLRQNGVVLDEDFQKVAPVFSSSFGQPAPYLDITPIPAPSTLLLMLPACVAGLLGRRSRPRAGSPR